MRNVKYCPNCGQELAKGSAFCSNCGTSLIDQSQKTSRVGRKQGKKQKTTIALAALALLAIDGY
ncbi:zinc ribbon domain-containing protein, partial [Lactobacillus equicursoris]